VNPGAYRQVICTDVDGQRERFARAVPLRALRNRMIQGPQRHPAYESGLFRERYEGDGPQQATGRMLPAYEYLGTRDASGCHFDFWLEEQAQFIVFDSVPELAKQR